MTSAALSKRASQSRRGTAWREGIAGFAIALLAGCTGRTDVPTKPPIHPIPDVTIVRTH